MLMNTRIVGVGCVVGLLLLAGCQPEDTSPAEAPEITLVPGETTPTTSANNATTPEAGNNQTSVETTPMAGNNTSAANATTPEEPVVDPYDFPEIEGWDVLEDTNPDPDIVEVNLRASRTDVEVAPGRTLNMMTYNESFPGPLLQAKVGDRVIVHFENALDQPTTVHWHGLRIPDDMDGSPIRVELRSKRAKSAIEKAMDFRKVESAYQLTLLSTQGIHGSPRSYPDARQTQARSS